MTHHQYEAIYILLCDVGVGDEHYYFDIRTKCSRDKKKKPKYNIRRRRVERFGETDDKVQMDRR